MSADSSLCFPTTFWTLVEEARDPASHASRTALDQLLRRYLKPLRFYLLLARRVAADDVDDLLQGFLLSKVLEQDLIGKADPARGKFRNLLLAAMNRYLADEFRRNGRRRTAAAITTIDPPAAAASVRSNPLQAFELEWARQILSQTLERFRESALGQGRQSLWAIFEGRVLRPTLLEAEPIGYAQLAADFELSSQEQAANLLITAKRMFRRTLRQVVAEYAQDEAAIDQEIADLTQILSEAGSTGK